MQLYDIATPPSHPPGGDAGVRESKPQRDSVFHALGALRGVAAIGVVIFHFQHFFPPDSVPGGYLAVDLFFIMSGVVLSHAYEPRFQNGMGAREFMRARLIRLYPLYFLGFIAGTTAVVASFLGNNIEHWDAARLTVAIALAACMSPSACSRAAHWH